MCYCLSFSPSLCHPLFFLGDVTSSEAVKWSQCLCCPPSIAAAHKQTVIIFCQGQDQCGEQSAHKTPLWRSDWFCTKYVSRTHTPRRAHTWSQADRHVSADACTHTHKKKNRGWAKTPNEPNFFPQLSCHAVIIPREKLICLLMLQMLSVFWPFKKMKISCLHGIHAITCSCFY